MSISTGKPIRDFVPVLVERMAREDLRAHREQPTRPDRQTARAVS
jgi:hypothetical protein